MENVNLQVRETFVRPFVVHLLQIDYVHLAYYVQFYIYRQTNPS